MKARIDPVKLVKLKREGKSVKHIAEFFSVSPQAVHKSFARVKRDLPAAAAGRLARVERIVDSNLDAMAEVLRVHAIAEELLAEARKAGDLSSAVSAVARMQKTMDQWLKMAEMMANWQRQMEFQEAVVATLEEIGPHATQTFRRKLAERRSLGFAASPPRPDGV